VLYNDFEKAPHSLPELYQLAKEQVYEGLKRQQTIIKQSGPERSKLPKNIPPCISYILREKPKKSTHVNFNKLVMNIASFFQMEDRDKADIWSMVKPFVKGYGHSETYDTQDKRIEHWRLQWQFIESRSDYKFDCSYVKGLRLPGAAFKCNRCVYRAKIQSNSSSAETGGTPEKVTDRKSGFTNHLERPSIHDEIISLIDKIAEKNLPLMDLYGALKPIKSKLVSLSPAELIGYLDYIKKKLKVKNDFIEPFKKEIFASKKAIKKKGDKKSKDAILSACFPGLIEMVWNGSHVAYLFKSEDQIKVNAYNSDESGNRITPPDRNDIPYPILSPDSILAHKEKSDNDLYFDVFDRLKGIAVLSSEEQFHLCTVYIFLTYLSDPVQYFPYLWFYAVPERGKSRMVKGIINLSYRGLYTETLNEAYLFRYADLFHGTIGIDVYNLSKKAQKKGSQDLLLGRFERGIKVARVVAVDKGNFKDTRYYDVYGPTILATNTEIPPQDPLRSRCIKITMPEARRSYPDNNRHEDLVDLKERLYAFRLRHLDTSLPEIKKPIPGRLGDILHPMLCVAALLPKESSEGLFKLMEQLEEDRRDAEARSLHGRIAQVIYDLQEEVKNRRLSIKKVREKLNEGVNEKYHIAPQTIGAELTAMDIPKIQKGGDAYISWDEEEKIKQIFKRYLGISSYSSYSSCEDMTNMTNMMHSESEIKKKEYSNQYRIPSNVDLKKLRMTPEEYQKLMEDKKI
jgi:hypothetical protein